MKRLTRRIGLFVLAALLMAPAALAQGNQQQQQQRPPAPEVDVNDAELKTVATAYLKVEKIQSNYMPQMRQAQQNQNRKKFMQLRQEFQQEVNTKLEAEENITPDRFNKIMRAAQADQELRNRLTSAIETARQNNSPDSTGGSSGSGN